MKQLKKDLQAVKRDLKKLAQNAEKMKKRLEKLEKAQAAKKSAAKSVKKVPAIDPVLARIMRDKVYPTDIILAHIIGNREGIDMVSLEKKTGFEYNRIKQIIQRLRIQGRIKSKRKKGLRGEAYGIGKSRTLYLKA